MFDRDDVSYRTLSWLESILSCIESKRQSNVWWRHLDIVNDATPLIARRRRVRKANARGISSFAVRDVEVHWCVERHLGLCKWKHLRELVELLFSDRRRDDGRVFERTGYWSGRPNDGEESETTSNHLWRRSRPMDTSNRDNTSHDEFPIPSRRRIRRNHCRWTSIDGWERSMCSSIESLSLSDSF